MQEKITSLNIHHQQQKHNGLKCSCVFYVRVDTIILHCLPSGQNCAQFHLQLLKLNKKPVVAVTEAVRFIRKANVEMWGPGYSRSPVPSIISVLPIHSEAVSGPLKLKVQHLFAAECKSMTPASTNTISAGLPFYRVPAAR